MSMRVKHRYMLKEKLARKLIEDLRRLYPGVFSGIRERKVRVERVILNGNIEINIIDGKPVTIKFKDNTVIPTINILNEMSGKMPKVVVDVGAVPYIVNGADVMIPGIVEVIGKFELKDIVAVEEERHGKVIAVGRALIPSCEVRRMRKGKAIENLHYVGDKLWNLIKTLR